MDAFAGLRKSCPKIEHVMSGVISDAKASVSLRPVMPFGFVVPLRAASHQISAATGFSTALVAERRPGEDH